MELTIKKLTVDLLNDWLAYFDNDAFSDGDEWPGCYCMHYHWDKKLDKKYNWNETLEHVYKTTGKSSNREHAIRLINNGVMRGYLAYESGKVVGWCNVNDKCVYNTVHNNFFNDIDKKRKIKSIVCFCIFANMRRKGIATKLLETICADAVSEGYDYIEAYPYTRGQYNDYHGSLTMFERMGFVKTGQVVDDCFVMRKDCKIIQT